MNINPINNLSFGAFMAPRYALLPSMYSPSEIPALEIDEPEKTENIAEEDLSPEPTEEEFTTEEILKFLEAQYATRNALNIQDISSEEAFLDAVMYPREEEPEKPRLSYSQAAEAYKKTQIQGKKIDLKA